MNFFDFVNTQPKKKDENNICDNFRVGDTIQIVKVENSYLNHYKGYVGEIKEYRVGNTHALVVLHAMIHLRKIKFPIKHLVKLK